VLTPISRRHGGGTGARRGARGVMSMRWAKRLLVMLPAFVCAACAVGPDYVRPSADAPPAYKEMPPAKAAQPADSAPRSRWWEVYGDSKLSELEEGVAAANQSLRAAEANYRQAAAAVQVARAGLYPTIGASAGVERARQAGRTLSAYSLGLPVDWEVDLWGKIQRQVESSEGAAQASAADLEATRLSLQAQLAEAYFGLRIADRQKKLLDETVAAYTRSLELTQNRYNAGVVARSDVVQAEAQLQAAQVQAVDINVSRAQFEHAMAVLIGKTPAEFSLATSDTLTPVPAIPAAVPSELLERRPDIAA